MINPLDVQYAKEFTDILEAIYGPGFLSEGCRPSVDLMFAGLNLENKTLLDIGSGLGGIDFYLAKKYNVNIIGIDRVLRLVNEANQRKINQQLIGNVTFVHQETDTQLNKYSDHTFDIVFSKETFLHIKNKPALLEEIFRVLKPGGKLIILDWLIENHQLGAHILEMIEFDKLCLKMSTLKEFKEYLQNVGFSKISTLNLNEQYIKFADNTIEKIETQKHELINQLGTKNYEHAIHSWDLQKTIFNNNEVVVTLLKATKPD
jgi:phosphoethanolamine N-methyltransferase